MLFTLFLSHKWLPDIIHIIQYSFLFVGLVMVNQSKYFVKYIIMAQKKKKKKKAFKSSMFLFELKSTLLEHKNNKTKL